MVKQIPTSDLPDEEGPILKPLSWGATRKMAHAQMKYQAASENKDLPLEERLEQMDKFMDEIQATIGSCVVSIPRSWLVDDAPEELDWKDPRSLDWLESSRFEELISLVSGQRAARNAKN